MSYYTGDKESIESFLELTVPFTCKEKSKILKKSKIYFEPKYKKHIFLVEGTIASGKSNLIDYFKRKFSIDRKQIIFVDEPLTQWTSGSKNKLKTFYENKAIEGFSFELLALQTKVEGFIKALSICNEYEDVVIIVENSFITSICFATNSYKSGIISECEYDSYKKLYSMFMECYVDYIDGVILLVAQRDIIEERIIERGREEEKRWKFHIR